jgi:DNA-binding NarL/FixJ family response regulator
MRLLPREVTLLAASSGLEFAEEQIDRLAPDFLIIALSQASLSWLGFILRQASRLKERVIVLTSERQAYLPPGPTLVPTHGLGVDEIAARIRASIDCETPANLAANPEPALSSTARDLSVREVEVLHLVAEGLCTKEIANKLNLSVRTVDFHRANIKRKTRCQGIAELTRYALGL